MESFCITKVLKDGFRDLKLELTAQSATDLRIKSLLWFLKRTTTKATRFIR
jgi:hypothetical protein